MRLRLMGAALVAFLVGGLGVATAGGAEVSQNYVTSWFGNTFGSAEQAVPYTVKSILLTDAGRVLINTRSSEQVYVHQIYGPDGRWEGKYHSEKKGGNAICSDGQYVYFNYDHKRDKDGVRLHKHRLSNYAKVQSPDVSDRVGDLVGMACAGGRLFLSDATHRTVHIYNASDLSYAGEIDIAGHVGAPGKIAADGRGNVWLIDTEDNEVHCYDTAGAHVGARKITSASVARPSAVAVDVARDLLFVADNGPGYDIKVFDISGAAPVLVETVGVKGGVYEGTTTKGTTGPLRFNGIYAMSVNGRGDLAVNCAGTNVWRGAEIRWMRRTADGWEETAVVRGDHFVDSADIDDGDETVIYSMDFKYRMDYNEPAGQQWTVEAVTTDPLGFPDDPRNHEGNKVIGVTVRRVRGHKLMYASSEDDRFLMIYRFEPSTHGEIAIPCGLNSHSYIADMAHVWGNRQPVDETTKKRWMWVDHDADGAIDANETTVLETSQSGRGYYVDSQGTIWVASQPKLDVKRGAVQMFALDPEHGFNDKGVPLYGPAPEPTPTVDPMRKISYAVYNPDTDVMVLFGATVDKPYTSGFDLPRAAARYDNWSSGEPTLAWLHDAFETTTLGAIHHVYAEGDFMFAGRRDGHVQVHRMSDGQEILRLEAGPEVGFTAGKLDHGPALLRARQRENGEYLVIVEEDGWCKLLLYQWAPYGRTEEQEQAPPTR